MSEDSEHDCGLGTGMQTWAELWRGPAGTWHRAVGAQQDQSQVATSVTSATLGWWDHLPCSPLGRKMRVTLVGMHPAGSRGVTQEGMPCARGG